MSENLEKISLVGYYNSLPKRISPKQKLLEDIQEECDRLSCDRPTFTTVRNWVKYSVRPKNPLHIEAITNVTGIREEDLWQ